MSMRGPGIRMREEFRSTRQLCGWVKALAEHETIRLTPHRLLLVSSETIQKWAQIRGRSEESIALHFEAIACRLFGTSVFGGRGGYNVLAGGIIYILRVSSTIHLLADRLLSSAMAVRKGWLDTYDEGYDEGADVLERTGGEYDACEREVLQWPAKAVIVHMASIGGATPEEQEGVLYFLERAVADLTFADIDLWRRHRRGLPLPTVDTATLGELRRAISSRGGECVVIQVRP